MIWYIGNQTQLEEDGSIYKYQVRYEEVDREWLRRRYEMWCDNQMVWVRPWHLIRRKNAETSGWNERLQEGQDEALVVSSEVESDGQD